MPETTENAFNRLDALRLNLMLAKHAAETITTHDVKNETPRYWTAVTALKACHQTLDAWLAKT